MSDEVDDSSPEPGLLFYYYETKIGEEAGTWWGQLAGGMHRLVTVREELEALRAALDFCSRSHYTSGAGLGSRHDRVRGADEV